MKKLLVLISVVALVLGGCGGSTINTVGLITMSPPSGSVQPGQSIQFTVDQNVLVDWTAPDGGTVSNGLFTAPVTPGTYRVIATYILNPLVSKTVLVTVADVAVSVGPTFLTVAKGSVSVNAFTAFVSGSPNTAVTWSVDEPNGGTIASGTADGSGNPRGTYTAGSTSGIFTIRATSSVDSSVFGTARAIVLGASSLGLSPLSATLSTTPPNNSLILTAVLTDSNGNVDSTTPLIWDIPTNPAGAVLSGSSLRQRTLTVPTSFVGAVICQARVRTSQGLAFYCTIQVVSG